MLTFSEVKNRCGEHPWRDRDDSSIMSRCRLLDNRTAWVFGYGECKARHCPKWARILSLRELCKQESGHVEAEGGKEILEKGE